MAKTKVDTKELDIDESIPKAYKPSDQETKVIEFVDRRITEMKEYRKKLKIEEEWKEADKEYVPTEIPIATKKRLEVDQDTGLRSRMVTVNTDDDSWRSNSSDPTLLNKIQTAFSIIIDKNPEAVLTALTKRFENTSDLMNGLWKRNWEITHSKELLKLFTFNLAKYGWAPARTFPHLVKYNKKVLTSIDPENPENNEYDQKELVWFNDVDKQVLDPYTTWIDEMTKPYDVYSMNSAYYELDFTYDSAKIEFGKYSNFELIGKSAKQSQDEKKKEDTEPDRKDIITIGFYQDRLKDLYTIYVPSKKILLHYSPLPNDDGLLDLWHSLWMIRDSKSPYGVSLWKIIKQDKQLYDKMSNMTMDQVVLSIMKMFFYTGTSNLFGDGQIKIKPGKGVQIQNGDVKWMDVPAAGKEAWAGLQWLKSKMDDNSGITPTLEGEVTGKTLGEVLHAKEASLKRLKTPLENIAWGIEQDAYVDLSWMCQIYSTPEIKNFATLEELTAYEQESGIQHQDLFGKPDEIGNIQDYKASFYPELSLHLEDQDGTLIESKDSKYFQIGKDIKLDQLKWRGIIKVVPKSLLVPSEELDKQLKAEVFNMIVPLLANDPNIFKKAVTQLIKSRDMDEKDWLPDSWLVSEQQPLFVPTAESLMAQQGMQQPQPGQTMQAQQGTIPNQGGPTVVPQNQTPPAARPSNLMRGLTMGGQQ